MVRTRGVKKLAHREEGSEPLRIRRQEEYCRYYVISLKQTESAVKAKYAKGTAGMQACHLMKKSCIQERIKFLQKKEAKALNITHSRVIQEMARIAFFDVRQILDSEGRYRDINELKLDESAVISSIEFGERKGKDGVEKQVYIKDIKFYDKILMLKALYEYVKPTPVPEDENNKEERETMVVAQMLNGLSSVQLNYVRKTISTATKKPQCKT